MVWLVKTPGWDQLRIKSTREAKREKSCAYLCSLSIKVKFYWSVDFMIKVKTFFSPCIASKPLMPFPTGGYAMGGD